MLDPQLVEYLKSLKPKTPPKPTRPNLLDRNPFPQDTDLDSLSPSDIRATYIAPARLKPKRPPQTATTQPTSSTSTSTPDQAAPEHLVNAGIDHLELLQGGGKVVIPRSALVQLIEQTITLSGAAMHGDDVIIERYSPTWHRFARLLRTSDLHKISSLRPAKSFKPKQVKQVATPKTTETAAQAVESTGSSEKDTSSQFAGKEEVPKPPASLVEHEYVVLTLDTRKKRVSTTRFRRLLDGTQQITPPPPDTLLKVEMLDKYLRLRSQLIVDTSRSSSL